MTRRTETRPHPTHRLHATVCAGPPLRLDRVTHAQERIRQHYYDRADVRRALVEALIVELAL